MSERLREIGGRVHHKLTQEPIEVAGGVVAGAATFILIYRSLVEGGVEPVKASLMTSGWAAGASILGEISVVQARRALGKK